VKDVHGYPISVVAKMVGITQQTIRLYEQRGLIYPQRTQGNTRLYTEENVEQLRFIQGLTQDMGLNLAGVEVVLSLKNQIEQLKEENKHLLGILYEAGEWVRDLMDNPNESNLPVRSVLGKLVKRIRIK
jgi:MerR family transcriptional regulator, heat shock protein HspR